MNVILFISLIRFSASHHNFVSPSAEAPNRDVLDDDGETSIIDDDDPTIPPFESAGSLNTVNATAIDWNITYSVTYLFSLTNTETVVNNVVIPTVVVTYLLQKIEVTKADITITTTPTATTALSTIVFHPGILIGVTSVLLFIIAAIYTGFCRKTAAINYDALVKAQKRKKRNGSDSASLEEVAPKKKKNSAKTSRQSAPKSTSRKAAKSARPKPKGKKG